MTVKLRHKKPEGTVSELQEVVLQGEAAPWAKMDGDYQFASGVALWGLGMREVVELTDEQRAVFLGLIRGAASAGYDEAGVEELLELSGKRMDVKER